MIRLNENLRHKALGCIRFYFEGLGHQQLQVPFVNRHRIVCRQQCVKVRNIILVCDAQCIFMNMVDSYCSICRYAELSLTSVALVS